MCIGAFSLIPYTIPLQISACSYYSSEVLKCAFGCCAASGPLPLLHEIQVPQQLNSFSFTFGLEFLGLADLSFLRDGQFAFWNWEFGLMILGGLL